MSKKYWRKRRASRPVYSTTPVVNEPTIDSAEITPYGAKRYRPDYGKGRFNGTSGTKPKAVILDIDGTLQDWGNVVNKKVLDWVDKHYRAGHVLIVLTARTHEHDYKRSFDWLVGHLPYPFIGPFHRSDDDPRYASEFKREVAESLSQLYTIVGAADDNTYVNDMWRHWAALHPEVDFDLLECSYSAYPSWRSEVGSGWSSTVGGWSTSSKKTSVTEAQPVISRALPLDTNSRVAFEDTVLDEFPSLSLSEVEKFTDRELLDLLPDEEGRNEKVTSRLDLEDDVYASYPDLGMAEIQQMDIEQLKLLMDHPDRAPAGGVV